MTGQADYYQKFCQPAINYKKGGVRCLILSLI